MTDFPDKEEVDATRKWYHGIGWDLLAVISSIAVIIGGILWIITNE